MMLGCGVFFSPFIRNYSDLVSYIPGMTKTTFCWDETTWKRDYRKLWEDFKRGLQQSCELFYPDYSLEWILRTDASDFGVGGMLIQLYVRTDGVVEQQVIAICSKKLSPQRSSGPQSRRRGMVSSTRPTSSTTICVASRSR
jgi:hypothetical protein